MSEPFDLAAIKARRALVSPPWHARPALTELGYGTHVVCLDAPGEGGPEEEADVWLYGRNVAVGLSGNAAEFVAHAPTDIDALLAEVGRLAADLATVDADGKANRDALAKVVRGMR